jgi:hypothetical protein
MLLKAVDNDSDYRILWLSEDRQHIYLFNIATSAMPESLQFAEVQRLIENGSFLIQENDPYMKIAQESEINEKERAIRDSIWDAMSAAVTAEPAIYEKKYRGAIIANLESVSGKQRKNLYVYLKKYWKHGKTKNAYLPSYSNCGAPGKERGAGAAKRGRPAKYGSTSVNVDENTRAIFEKAIKKYYHTREEHTLQYAYDMMVADYYARYVTQPDGKKKAVLNPIEQIPTIRQFRYWYHKTHDFKESIARRKGATKFELEHRAVLGKSDHGIMGPGAKYQIDATVGDIYLVSRFNRADIIGRPIIYFIVDVFSRMVAGMYVGLEGPSWAGAMMALANAMSDKVKFCAEYGKTITEDEWPCFGVPGAILGDRGELESKAADTLVNALNVRIENAPPYRGDMKGIIEQYFNTTNETALTRLPGHVKPDLTERGGKDYRLDAKLDIGQLTRILIECVLHHNNQHLLENYERTADMIADGVVPIPLEIWNWGIAHCSGALRSFPEDKIKLALMPVDTATVTVKGIKYRNVYYICERAVKEYWFEKARTKSWKVDISYDPRNMSAIYVRNSGGFVEFCRLSGWQEKYIGKSLDEILFLHETEKATQRRNAPKGMASKAELSSAIDDVIAEAEELARQTAVPKSKLERTKNIRDNRRGEKAANRRDEAFSLGTGELETPATPKTQNDGDAPVSPILEMIKQQLDEREQKNDK